MAWTGLLSVRDREQLARHGAHALRGGHAIVVALETAGDTCLSRATRCFYGSLRAAWCLLKATSRRGGACNLGTSMRALFSRRVALARGLPPSSLQYSLLPRWCIRVLAFTGLAPATRDLDSVELASSLEPLMEQSHGTASNLQHATSILNADITSTTPSWTENEMMARCWERNHACVS